jgi:hypothetical protein
MKHWLSIAIFLLTAVFMKFVLAVNLNQTMAFNWFKLFIVLVIFFCGIKIVFQRTTKIIEETTEALKPRTGLAGGFLQSFGTAFPDMVLGVVAAFMSLAARNDDYSRAINLAIIAAATTFGSNIYNIGHAAWCIWRQNLANKLNKLIFMFPLIQAGGQLKPLSQQTVSPRGAEIDQAVKIIISLTMLTTVAALSMVLFGQLKFNPAGVSGDLYQLKQWPGVLLLILCLGVLYIFRKNEGKAKEARNNYYHGLASYRIWLDLALAGLGILFAAEAMVAAMEVFSEITHLPFVVTGIVAGIIGCLGEIMVVHNFTIHPQGKIGDAIVGVAMDNIVTTLGAAIVAIIGGIFLGGNSLIIIFIIILTANTILLHQLYMFRNSLVK